MFRVLALFAVIAGIGWWLGFSIDWYPDAPADVIVAWDGHYYHLDLFQGAIIACALIGALILGTQLVSGARGVFTRR